MEEQEEQEEPKKKRKFDFVGIWRNFTFYVSIFGLILLIIERCSH